MKTKSGVDLSVCAYCNTPLDDYSRTVDHLYPKSRGGILSNDNKVPSCGECNKLKGNMNVREFVRALSSMIYKEHNRHKAEISYLKKVKKNSEQIIEKLNEKQRSVRSDAPGSRQNRKQTKKRP
jgi:5-methylcytosine-specific restriction endonuclease McrA